MTDPYQELPPAFRAARWRPGADISLDGEVLTLGPGRQPAHGELRLWTADGQPGFRLELPAHPGEAFLGLGERFDRLDLRGGDYITRVYDPYKRQGAKSYLPVPFFVSTRGYGLWLDTPHPARWRFGAHQVRIDVLGTPSLRVRRFEGAPLEVVAAFARAVGLPPAPPAWAFGPWMSGNEWNSETRVRQVVERSLQLGIPVSAIVIEAWSDEATFYLWNDARYAPRDPGRPPRLADFEFPVDGRWPDPRGLIDWLHGLGIRVLLWQIPVIRHPSEPNEQLERDRAFALERGFLLRADDGPYRSRSPWFEGSHLPDFANPEARDWWLSLRRYLLEELGVDGFKTDGGEHVWGSDVRSGSGLSGHALANLYPLLYTEAVARLVHEARAEGGLLFSRAGYTGSQRLPFHWTGDHDSDWEALRSNLIALLSASASGFSFIGWDLAGFSGPLPSAELYKRAAAIACFTPLMQYHSELNDYRDPPIDRTPWNVAEQTGDRSVIEVYRDLARLRTRLVPYLHEQAALSACTGIPLMRPLLLAYPQDIDARECRFQYSLGADLLVCPVVEPDAGQAKVHLPDGQWWDFWSGEKIPGGRIHRVPLKVGRVPVFTRRPRLAAPHLR